MYCMILELKKSILAIDNNLYWTIQKKGIFVLKIIKK